MQYMDYSVDFRDRHQYNNLMYSLSDLVIQTLSGSSSWEDVLRERYLIPLEMDQTTFGSDEERWPEFATNYINDGGNPRPVSLEVPR